MQEMTYINDNGNTVETGFLGFEVDERSRYHYDFGDGLPDDKSDWRQWDTEQDASYFGVWVNFKTRQTFTYCEGDTTLVTCEDNAHLQKELDSMIEFYGPPPGHVRTIDAEGNYEQHPDTRPTIENPNPPSVLAALLGA